MPLIRHFALPLFFAVAAQAQDPSPVVVQGRIVDARSGQPVPASSISAPQYGIHTLANDSGYFVLKLPARSSPGDSCHISHIGYHSLRTTLSAIHQQRIRLTEQALALPSFQVRAMSATRLIERAIDRIPANHFSKPHVLRGFYRLTSRKGGDYFHLSEAAFDCWHPDGSGRQRKLRLLKARMEKDVTPFNGSENILIGMQPDVILGFDFPAQIREHPVLGRKGLTEHHFTVSGTELINGRDAWKIDFDQRDGLRKSRYQGAVYIDTATLAFVRLETRLSPRGIVFWEVPSAGQRALMQLLNIHEQMLQDSLLIQFHQVGDKFFPGNVRSRSLLRLYSPRLRFDFQARSQADFVITRIDTTPDLPFADSGIVARQSFIERHSAIDTSDFWKPYNLLLPDFNTDSVAAAIRARQTAIGYKKELENRLRKMPGNKAARLDSVFAFYHRKGMFNGVASVQFGNALLYSKAFGLADRNLGIPNDTATVFRIGSVSKQFTAMLVMLLQEEGKLSTEDSVGKYLPGFAHGAVMLAQLLTHRSGIPDYTSNAACLPDILARPMPIMELVTRYCQDSLTFAPGAQFRYSNSGYAILAAVVEKAAGIPFAAVLEEKITGPLDMRDTRFGTPPSPALIAMGYEGSLPEIAYPVANMPGCGGIYSSVPDLRKWENALIECRLLPCARLSEMFTPRADYADWHAGYGYGWMTDRMLFSASRKHTVQYHPGTDGGFYSMQVRQPDRGITLTMLCNSGDFPRFDMTDLVLEILN